uniref:Solute carrier organic anion transporter family member n=1 Tax=Denticeps clupeoides TaxID=299321 RepID=A0AAY4BF73_9TELE
MDNQADSYRFTSQEVLCPAERKAGKTPCCSTLKMFIVALSFAYFSKALSGTYMKSSITQIERRFDLSSSLVGLIDGSFEMGNLLFLALVSHFGAKMHRPRLIAVGCLLMAVGSALTGLKYLYVPMNLYRCVSLSFPECVKDPGSNMWIYVFLGNALRGIGETPVTPLGISYIDDFAKAENSAFYIACLQTITLLGPMFGFLLGSMCAKLYVDIGFVNVDTVTITPKDARWVGAWWLGFFVSSAIMLLSGIPFWFLPRSLPKQGKENKELPDTQQQHPGITSVHSQKLTDIAKGFLPSLKKLLSTPTYFLLLCGSVLKFNSFIGLLTFKAKYMEQQFGQSASRANFLIGVLNLPVVAVGIFLGGLLMKRYKLSVVAGAQLSFLTSFTAYLLLLLQYGTKSSKPSTPGISHDKQWLFSECNRNCSCRAEEWDPVCSENGITYVSPCLAGCTGSTGHGKHTMFHNCSCVLLTPPPAEGSASVTLGQCPRGADCSRSFTSYMAVSVLSSFINSLGSTPGYMIIIRCIKPQLKSLALGIQTLVMRTLGGIPAPVYFGAFIDSSCLKWGMKKCGGRGACRLYDSDMYRLIFLGLITCLSGSAYFFIIALIVLLRQQFAKEDKRTAEQAPKPGQIELKVPCDFKKEFPVQTLTGTKESLEPRAMQVTKEAGHEEAVTANELQACPVEQCPDVDRPAEQTLNPANGQTEVQKNTVCDSQHTDAKSDVM